MSAPEQIYLDGDAEAGDGYFTRCFETSKPCSEPPIGYTRADIPAARIAELEAENARLRAIEEAAKHLRALDEDEFEVIVGNCAYHNLRAALNKG